jgi:hypothetical protein
MRAQHDSLEPHAERRQRSERGGAVRYQVDNNAGGMRH